MPLTKEERKQRATQRREELDELARRYPGAQFYNGVGDAGWIQVVLVEGDSQRMMVRVRGPFLAPEASRHGVAEATVYLGKDLEDLAEMIRGLTLRYNAMIAELNEEVESTPALKRAKAFEAGNER